MTATHNKANILIVDDEPSFLKALHGMLDTGTYTIYTSETFSEAEKIIIETPPDVVILDLVLPDRSGMELIPIIKEHNRVAEIIVLTGHGSIDSAVEATKRGAFAYLPKPIQRGDLTITVRNALQVARLKEENTRLKDTLKKEYRFENIVGASESMQNIFRTIEKISGTDSTILITGESGTGKELIARAIHYCSQRSKNHLVTINCGAIPEDLLESELFGHVKGSFTGAISTRIGRFEVANNGTVFLDEIGDTPQNLQVKLLRFLQEKTFEPVGSNQKVIANVRIIAATHQNLRSLIQEKKFREDLFYRLNVIPIDLPPLRERLEDIPLLIKYFTHRICKRQNRPNLDIDPIVIDLLCQYAWPGNVRELENLIEQLIVFTEDKIITPKDLPKRFRTPSFHTGSELPENFSKNSLGELIKEDSLDFNQTIDKLERALILSALRETRWNKNKAAGLLKLNRTTLIEKMKKKRITKPEEKPSTP